MPEIINAILIGSGKDQKKIYINEEVSDKEAFRAEMKEKYNNPIVLFCYSTKEKY